MKYLVRVPLQECPPWLRGTPVGSPSGTYDHPLAPSLPRRGAKTEALHSFSFEGEIPLLISQQVSRLTEHYDTYLTYPSLAKPQRFLTAPNPFASGQLHGAVPYPCFGLPDSIAQTIQGNAYFLPCYPTSHRAHGAGSALPCNLDFVRGPSQEPDGLADSPCHLCNIFQEANRHVSARGTQQSR